MKKIKNELKLFVTLILSVAMLVTEIPMTAFAVSTDIVNIDEKEVTEGQTQAEEMNEEGSLGNQTEEISEEETTGQDSGDEESREEEATEQVPGDEENSEEATTEQDLEDAENSEEEAIEEQDKSEESAEEIMPSSASDFVINGSVLTSYAGTDEDVVIPEGTVEIAKSAFENNKTIKTVTFPSTLTTIGKFAFAGCSNLGPVDLNEGLVSIGEQAFANTALGKKLDTGKIEYGTLTIPSTVQNIGLGAFYNCAYLGTVVFEDGDTEVLTIDSSYFGTFSSCPELTKITLPKRLTSITAATFMNNPKLNEVILGDKVETIGKSAFSNCSSLKNINFPSSLRTIGGFAFEKCGSLGMVDLNEGLVSIGEQAFASAALGEKLASGKVELGTLTIPSTVQNIGLGAFFNCAYLGTVVFANGDTEVLTIDSSHFGTFSSCPELTKITLPERLIDISNYSFVDNPKLNEVILGDKVETIGKSAFSNCGSLKSINLPSSLRTIGGWAFEKCSSLVMVDLNEGLVTIGEAAFSGAALGEKLTSGKVEPGTLIIPGTVQSIGLGAFHNCACLGTVIFANGYAEVLTIDTSYYGTFSECPELTMVILPERITALKGYTFLNNPKLQKLYIPSSVTEIENNAISNCPKLTIYGISGSKAESYAKEHNIPFKNKDALNSDFAVQSVKVTPSVIERIGENVIGNTTQLTATVLPSTAQNRAVSYKSDDEAVATVDQNGLVTIMGYGETRITVTTVDGGKTASCTVVVLKEPIDERSDIADASVLFPKNKPEYSAIYTGEQIRPVMAVSYQYKDDKGRTKTQKLKLNVDYTVFYSNNVNAGENTAKVTVRGIGEYKGVSTKEFTITPKNIKGVALSPVGDIVFDENLNDKLDEKPSVVIMDGTHELTRDKDYEVVLSTTGSASTDTQSELTVKGIGNYTGTSKKKVKFNILKTGTEIQPISPDTVSVAFKKLPAKGYTYNGKAQKPAVVVTDKSTGKKVAASYYKVIYTNNINAGTANAWVVGVTKKGKGYCGMISEPLTFEIKPKELNKVKVSTKGLIPKVGTIEDIQKSVEEALTVKDGKHILSSDEYEIGYGDIKKAGDINIGTKYPITLTAKAGGNYVEGSQKVFNIKFGQLSLASKTANISVRIADAEQNEIILRYNGTLLEKDTDYTAVVTKDKKKDTYTVKIKAVKNGAYKGSRTIKNLQL